MYIEVALADLHSIEEWNIGLDGGMCSPSALLVSRVCYVCVSACLCLCLCYCILDFKGTAEFLSFKRMMNLDL